MSDVPFDVIMRGPAAVATWLEQRDAETKRKGRSLVASQITIMQALHLDPTQPDAKITAENIAISLGALTQVAVIIAYTAKGGMRGPARDALAEIVDACFDVVDNAEADSPQFAAIIQALRAAK